VDTVALGQVSPSPSVLRFNIIPPLFHIHSCIVWGMEASYHRDIVSSHHNSNSNNGNILM
jgi:hypothetical protein